MSDDPLTPDRATPGRLAPGQAPALYAAFDRYPSTKGAGVHIREFADTLFDHAGGGLLHVLGGDDLAPYQCDLTAAGDTVEIVRFGRPVANLLDRVDAYGTSLTAVARIHAPWLRIAHVRDPWSAAPLIHAGLAGRASAPARVGDAPRRPFLVYEVNGLPSVELPYSYPQLGLSTLAKIQALELDCLAAADAIITPSQVLADRLADRLDNRAGDRVADGLADRRSEPASGGSAPRITVIRNGARPPTVTPVRPPDAPTTPYVVYVGALQPWQGIDTLLAAFARLADLRELRLVICSATPAKRARGWQRLAARAGVGAQVDWHFKVPHRDVAGWLAHAAVSVAPLTDCSRNVDQGCCPLKVLESMAVGTAVIASDLPVTRELVVDGDHGRLVPPDRPAELARAIRIALEYPDQTRAQGARAGAHVRDNLTWERSRAALTAVYEGLGA